MLYDRAAIDVHPAEQPARQYQQAVVDDLAELVRSARALLIILLKRDRLDDAEARVVRRWLRRLA